MTANGEKIGQAGENLHPKLVWLTEYRKLDDKDKRVFRDRLCEVTVNGQRITEPRIKKWLEQSNTPSIDEAKAIIEELNKLNQEIKDLPKLLQA